MTVPLSNVMPAGKSSANDEIVSVDALGFCSVIASVVVLPAPDRMEDTPNDFETVGGKVDAETVSVSDGTLPVSATGPVAATALAEMALT